MGLIILIRVTIDRDHTFISGDREFFSVIVSVAVVLVIFLAGARVFETLPDFGTPIFAQVSDTASENYLTA